MLVLRSKPKQLPNKLTPASQSKRFIGLGIRYHASITDPLDLSKERIEAFISIPVSSNLSVVVGYRFNNELGLGVRLDF